MIISKRECYSIIKIFLSIIHTPLEVRLCYILRALHWLIRVNRICAADMGAILDSLIALLLHPNVWVRRTIEKILLDFQQQGEKGQGEVFTIQGLILKKYPEYFRIHQTFLDTKNFLSNIKHSLPRIEFDKIFHGASIDETTISKHLHLFLSPETQDDIKHDKEITRKNVSELNVLIKAQMRKHSWANCIEEIEFCYSMLNTYWQLIFTNNLTKNKYQTYMRYESEINSFKLSAMIEESNESVDSSYDFRIKLCFPIMHKLYFTIKQKSLQCQVTNVTAKLASQPMIYTTSMPQSNFHFRNIHLNSFYEHRSAVTSMCSLDFYLCTCDIKGNMLLWNTANILGDGIGYSDCAFKISDTPILATTAIESQNKIVALSSQDQPSSQLHVVNVAESKIEKVYNIPHARWIQSLKLNDNLIACIGDHNMQLFDIREAKPVISTLWSDKAVACFDYDEDYSFYFSYYNKNICHMDIRTMAPSLFCTLPEYSTSIALFNPGNNAYFSHFSKDTNVLVSRPLSKAVAIDIYDANGMRGSLTTNYEICGETLLDSVVPVENDLIEYFKKRLSQTKKCTSRIIYVPSYKANNRHILCADELGRIHYWDLNNDANIDYLKKKIVKKENRLPNHDKEPTKPIPITALRAYEFSQRTYLISANQEGEIKIWI